MRDFFECDKPLIRIIGERGIVYWSDEPITFKSGIKSHVYVSGRSDLTGDQAALSTIGNILRARAVRALPQEIVSRRRIQFIGIPTAGTPLAVAAAISIGRGMIAGCRIMREVKKSHGNDHRWVDGEPRSDEYYVTVDNVITDGQSKLEAIARLREDGYSVKKMLHLIFVDRNQGGMETLRTIGYNAVACIALPTVVLGLVEQGFWPRERLECYQIERAEWAALHQ